MDAGDSLALIAGIIIVIFIAVLANSGLGGLQIAGKPAVPVQEVVHQIPVPVTTLSVLPEEITAPQTLLPGSHNLPYRIFYTDTPYSYPSYMIPQNMETFGASEIPQKTLEWVPFAYIEDTRGGLTEIFSVPYPVWMINSTIITTRHPQSAIFRMALCYADSGGIIEGEEILNRGTSYRIVQTSNTDVYMIISAVDVDSFYIVLETPKKYYDSYGPT